VGAGLEPLGWTVTDDGCDAIRERLTLPRLGASISDASSGLGGKTAHSDRATGQCLAKDFGQHADLHNSRDVTPTPGS